MVHSRYSLGLALAALAMPLMGADYVHMDDTTKSWLGAITECNATTGKLNWDAAAEAFKCDSDQTGAGGGDAITVESGDNTGAFGAATDAQFEDQGDINFVLTGASPSVITGEIRAGAVGTAEAAALDAGDITTGTLADALVSGGNEEDEIDLLDLRDSAAAGGCTASQQVRRNASDTGWECFTASSSASNSVEVTLDFGAAGDTSASVVVTGQAWVTSSSEIVCAPTLMASADRAEGEEDAVIEGLTVAAHTRVAATGFTLTGAVQRGLAFGRFTIHCVGV